MLNVSYHRDELKILKLQKIFECWLSYFFDNVQDDLLEYSAVDCDLR